MTIAVGAEVIVNHGHYGGCQGIVEDISLDEFPNIGIRLANGTHIVVGEEFVVRVMDPQLFDEIFKKGEHDAEHDD